jgi:hypothetical protein
VGNPVIDLSGIPIISHLLRKFQCYRETPIKYYQEIYIKFYQDCLTWSYICPR